jgi:hypothetical protein
VVAFEFLAPSGSAAKPFSLATVRGDAYAVSRMRPTERDRGQGMTEHLVIAALVGIIVLGVLVSFGDDVRHLFDSSGAAPTPEATGSPKKAGGKSADVPRVEAKPSAN